MVQQRGTVKHKYHREVSGNNEHGQKYNDGSLQDASLQAFIEPPAQGTRVVCGPARKEVSMAAVGNEHRVRCHFRLVHCSGCDPGGSGLWCATHKAAEAAGVKLEKCLLLPPLYWASAAHYSLSLSPSFHIAGSQSNEHRLEENQYSIWEDRTARSALLFQSLMVSESSGWVAVRSRKKSCTPSALILWPASIPEAIFPAVLPAGLLPHLLILMRVATRRLRAFDVLTRVENTLSRKPCNGVKT